jgi:hypothetical protein
LLTDFNIWFTFDRNKWFNLNRNKWFTLIRNNQLDNPAQTLRIHTTK